MDNIKKFNFMNQPLPGVLMPERNAADEEAVQRDYEYMKRLYPQRAKFISILIEDACDRMEYEGSPMFAEYPDPVTVHKIASDIYEQLQGKEEVEATDVKRVLPPPYVPDRGKRMDNPLRQLIEVMLCNEMHCRRNRYRRRKRFFM